MENNKGRHGEVVSEIRKLLKDREIVPIELIQEYNGFCFDRQVFVRSLFSTAGKIFTKESDLDGKTERVLPNATHEWNSGNAKINKSGDIVIPDSGYQPIIDGVIAGLMKIIYEEKEPIDTDENSTSKAIPFKRGDMLIREWENGDVDYCEFNKHEDTILFTAKNFYKFRNDKNLNSITGYYSFTYELDLSVFALKYNWKRATSIQIEYLNKLLGKEEKEVWWLCNESVGNYFTRYKKYKQISYNKNTITFVNDLGSEHNVYKDGVVDWFTKVEENEELEEAKEYLIDYIKSPFCNDETESILNTILNNLNK